MRALKQQERPAEIEGAAKVVAYEPEPANAALFRENHKQAIADGTVELRESAVVADPSVRTADLVLAKNRPADDAGAPGLANTWRHALSGLSHYKDADQLPTVAVQAMPFYGAGVSSDGNSVSALSPDVSFVKVDIEGAELAILKDAIPDGAFDNVSRLVFEWSFTKERSMAV